MPRKKIWKDYVEDLRKETEDKDWKILRDKPIAPRENKKSVVVIREKTANQKL